MSDIWTTVFASARAGGSSNEDAARKADDAVEFANAWNRRSSVQKVEQTPKQLKADSILTDPLDIVPNFNHLLLTAVADARIDALEIRIEKLEAELSLR